MSLQLHYNLFNIRNRFEIIWVNNAKSGNRIHGDNYGGHFGDYGGDDGGDGGGCDGGGDGGGGDWSIRVF